MGGSKGLSEGRAMKVWKEPTRPRARENVKARDIGGVSTWKQEQLSGVGDGQENDGLYNWSRVHKGRGEAGDEV